MKKTSREENSKVFYELHRLGMKKIVVDNGQYYVVLDRDEILPPPDWSGTTEINIPITNPNLQHAMIRLFQNLYSNRSNYDGNEGLKQHLLELEGRMIDEIIQGRYLVPVKLTEKGESSESDEEGTMILKQGATLHFACLVAEDQTSWLPGFLCLPIGVNLKRLMTKWSGAAISHPMKT